MLSVAPDKVGVQQEVEKVGTHDRVAGNVYSTFLRGEFGVAVVPEDGVGHAGDYQQEDVVAAQSVNCLSLALGHHVELRQSADHVNVQGSGPEGIKKGSVVQVGVNQDGEENAKDDETGDTKRVSVNVVSLGESKVRSVPYLDAQTQGGEVAELIEPVTSRVDRDVTSQPTSAAQPHDET